MQGGPDRVVREGRPLALGTLPSRVADVAYPLRRGSLSLRTREPAEARKAELHPMDAAALLIGLTALMLITFLGLEAAAFVRWRGAWRIAAAVPALALAGVVARVALDVRRDPTSHNLWPLEIAVWLLGGLMLIALLFGARSLSLSRRA